MNHSIRRAMRVARADGGPVDEMGSEIVMPPDGLTTRDILRAAGRAVRSTVEHPFNFARRAREAGGFSRLDPDEVGREGLNTGLGMVGAGGVIGRRPRNSIGANSPFFDEEMRIGAPNIQTREKPQVRELDEMVREWSKPRDGMPSNLKYDEYLRNPNATVAGRDRGAVANEGEFARAIPQNIKNLSHYRNIDRMRGYRDGSLYNDPDYNLVNPWYWPGPGIEMWKRFLPEDEAHRSLSRILQYSAPTSIQTAVSPNIREGALAYYKHGRGDFPLGPHNALRSDFTGAAYGTKLNTLNRLAQKGLDEGFGPSAWKIKNYGKNLHGEGIGPPMYGPDGRLLERPVTLDSQIAEAIRFRGKEGQQLERFKGPQYTETQRLMHRMGEEVGAGGSDTQAAIWQTYLKSKHPTQAQVYGDPFWRIFEDRVNMTARARGEHPMKTWEKLILQKEPIYSIVGPPIPAPGGDE